jgi:hypothetical protein
VLEGKEEEEGRREARKVEGRKRKEIMRTTCRKKGRKMGMKEGINRGEKRRERKCRRPEIL